MKKDKIVNVHSLRDENGRLVTTHIQGRSVKIAEDEKRKFDREIKAFDKLFSDYAAMDITEAKMRSANNEYIIKKLGIADKYIEYVPLDDMLDSVGETEVAIAGNKSAGKLGITSRLARVAQPFVEKQAEKHPRWQKLADNVTKAANGGNMPLTADSAAMMRLAFDKRFYDECRQPGADVEQLSEQHSKAIMNLKAKALYDGVGEQELSDKFAEKLNTQLHYDERLSDVYSGMNTGAIRFAKKGKGFVSAKDPESKKNLDLDAWSFEVREPQSKEELLAEYSEQFGNYLSNCQTEGHVKNFLGSTSYKSLETSYKRMLSEDCPGDSKEIKYELNNVCKIRALKEWAETNSPDSPFARLEVPNHYAERDAGTVYSHTDKHSTDADMYDDDENERVTGYEDEFYSETPDWAAAEEQASAAQLSEEKPGSTEFEQIMQRLDEISAENKRLAEENEQLRQQLAEFKNEKQSDRVIENPTQTVFDDSWLKKLAISEASKNKALDNTELAAEVQSNSKSNRSFRSVVSHVTDNLTQSAVIGVGQSLVQRMMNSRSQNGLVSAEQYEQIEQKAKAKIKQLRAVETPVLESNDTQSVAIEYQELPSVNEKDVETISEQVAETNEIVAESETSVNEPQDSHAIQVSESVAVEDVIEEASPVQDVFSPSDAIKNYVVPDYVFEEAEAKSYGQDGYPF